MSEVRVVTRRKELIEMEGGCIGYWEGDDCEDIWGRVCRGTGMGFLASRGEQHKYIGMRDFC